MSPLLIVSLIYLTFLLYISIKHPNYVLTAFIPLFSIFPVTFKMFGMSVFRWGAIIVIFTAFFYRNTSFENIKGNDKLFYLYAVFIFLLSGLTSMQYMTFSTYFINMFGFLIDYILIGLFFNHCRLSIESVRSFDIMLYITTLIVILYACYNYVFNSNPYQAYVALITNAEVDMSNAFQEMGRGVLQGRISSFFNHPLMLGQWILLISSYILFKLKKYYTIRGLAILMFYIISFLSGSRSSLVPLSISILIYIIAIKKYIKKYMFFLGIVIMIVGYTILPKQIQTSLSNMIMFWDEKVAERIDMSGSSLLLRQQQINSMQKILGDDIIWGRGNGYVTREGTKHSEMLGYESIIFKEIFDNGIIGFCFFLLFYMSLYYKLLMYATNQYNKMRVHALSLPFLLSGFMTGFQYPTFTIYIILYILTYFSIRNEEKKNGRFNHHCQLQYMWTNPQLPKINF